METDSIKFELGGNTGANIAHHAVKGIKQFLVEHVYDNIYKTIKHMILRELPDMIKAVMSMEHMPLQEIAKAFNN